MTLSDRSLAWLRALDREVATGTPLGDGGREALARSAPAVTLMARHTPAWTERYAAIVDRLIGRVLRGDGVDGPATAHDGPAEAAPLLLLLGLRAGLGGDNPWARPFRMAGDPDGELPWTHTELAAHVAASWPGTARSDPGATTALAMAGLGLVLADRACGSDHHRHVVAPWWEAARHDLDTLERGPALAVACWVAPFAESDARRLFDAAMASSGAGPAEPAGGDGFALLLARNWGLAELVAALGPSVADTDPLAAAAEACAPGAWTALAGPRPQPCPQLVDVDFPRLAITRAEWANGCLTLRLVAPEEQRHVFSSFRIVGAEPRIWCLSGIDGVTTDVTSREVIVRVPLRSGELEFTPGSY